MGRRSWIVNAQVPLGLRPHRPRRPRPRAGATSPGSDRGARGRGRCSPRPTSTTLVTATDDGGVRADATVGVRVPIWAAAPDELDRPSPGPGTINIVVLPPDPPDRRGALVNTVATATEAKTQALLDCGVRARAPPPTPCASSLPSSRQVTSGRMPRCASAVPGRAGAPGWPEPSTAPWSPAPAAASSASPPVSPTASTGRRASGDHARARRRPLGQVGGGRAPGTATRAGRATYLATAEATESDPDMAARIEAHRPGGAIPASPPSRPARTWPAALRRTRARPGAGRRPGDLGGRSRGLARPGGRRGGATSWPRP